MTSLPRLLLVSLVALSLVPLGTAPASAGDCSVGLSSWWFPWEPGPPPIQPGDTTAHPGLSGVLRCTDPQHISIEIDQWDQTAITPWHMLRFTGFDIPVTYSSRTETATRIEYRDVAWDFSQTLRVGFRLEVTAPIDASAGDHRFDQVTFRRTPTTCGQFCLVQSVGSDRPPFSITTDPIVTTSPGGWVHGVTTIAGSARDVDGIGRIDVSIDGGPFSPASGTTSWSYGWDTVGLADGAHTAVVRATDGVGASTSVTIAYELKPPTLQLNQPIEGSQVSGVVYLLGDVVSPATPVVLTYRVDGGPPQAAPPPPLNIPWDSATVPDGSHAIQVIATDADGRAASVTRNVVVDNPPRVQITSPAVDAAVATSSLAITGTAEDSGGIASVEVRVDDNRYYPSRPFVPANGTETWTSTVDLTALPERWFYITARATDTVGQTRETPVVPFFNDRTAPSVWFLSPAEDVLVTGTVEASGCATDSGGIATVELASQDGTWSPVTRSGSCWIATIDTTTFPDGRQPIRIRATDRSGRTKEAALYVRVDNGPPLASITRPLPGHAYVRGNDVGRVDALGSSVLVEGDMPIDVIATDAVGISFVQICYFTSTRAQLSCEVDRAAPYSGRFWVGSTDRGERRVEVQAFDLFNRASPLVGLDVIKVP